MSRLTRDGTAEPFSRDQILRRERGQGNIRFPCSAGHEQNWQPYSVDPYDSLAMCVTIQTYIAEYGSTWGKVANPARGQLKRENGYFPVPVRA